MPKVLVAGASGLVGMAALRHFASLPGWEAVGVSRRRPDIDGVQLSTAERSTTVGPSGSSAFFPVDLLDPVGCDAVFGAMSDVTHLVYAALHETPGLFAGWIDDVVIDTNAAMLRNLFEPLSRTATGLEHVSLLHGTKAYGLHHPSLGVTGLRLPLKERDPLRPHRNFYFEQQSYLEAKQVGHHWGLTTFRPTVIYGDASGANMNPALAIGAYAAILKEAGEPLHFPGATLEPRLVEAVDADLVAHALAWAATSPSAAGNAYNLTNGDVFVWNQAWEAIAEAMEMDVGEHRPMSFARELVQRADEWASIVSKYRLGASADLVTFAGYNSLVYCDVMVGSPGRPGATVLNSTIQARQHGFHDCLDTEDMFRAIFRRLRAKRLLP
jgi:nucleoside-diphosphate-sugar epimerase